MKKNFTLKKQLSFSIFVALLLMIVGESKAQTTYYWVGGAGSITAPTNWTTAANWNTNKGGGGSVRTTPNAGDVLMFDGTDIGGGIKGTVYVGSLPTQTVAKLILQSGANVVFATTSRANAHASAIALSNGGVTGGTFSAINATTASSYGTTALSAAAVGDVVYNQFSFSAPVNVGQLLSNTTGSNVYSSYNLGGQSSQTVYKANMISISQSNGFMVNDSSILSLSAGNAFAVKLLNGASGTISGTINVTCAGQRIITQDATYQAPSGALTFASGSALNITSTIYGNVFDYYANSTNDNVIFQAGSSYNIVPPVTATGTAIILNGSVTGINVVERGSGYLLSPTVTFTGGGGTGANAIPFTFAIGGVGGTSSIVGGSILSVGTSALTLTTSAVTATGSNVLTFASTATTSNAVFYVGQTVTGTNIPANTTIVATSSTTITLNNNISNVAGVPSGTLITFGSPRFGSGYTSAPDVIFGAPTAQATSGLGLPFPYNGVNNLSCVKFNTGSNFGMDRVGTSLAITLNTNAAATTGNSLSFGNNSVAPANIYLGQPVVGTNIPNNTIVTGISGNTITLNNSVTGVGVANGAAITFNNARYLPNFGTRTFPNFKLSNGTDITLSGSGIVTVDTLVFNGGATNSSKLTLGGSSNGLTVSNIGRIKFNSIKDTLALGGKTLTLQSSNVGTASIDSVTSSNNISGATNVTVERFIPSLNRKKYVLVSSPVTSTINAGWQEANATVSGYGTHITAGVAQNTNGFDGPASSGVSIYTYDDNKLGAASADPKWITIPNTTDANSLAPGKGYLLFVRGDRAVDRPADISSSNTTLRAKGTLGQGAISPTLLTGANKYTLIANPYPSIIDWQSTSISKAGLSNSFTVYDPNLGVFVTSDGTTKSPNVGQQQARYLQSGQAFFVQNDGTANPHSITFNEGAKVDGTTVIAQTVFTTPATSNAHLNINFYAAEGNVFADGAVALFGTSYKSVVDEKEDVQKFNNFNETVGLTRQGKVLGIEARPNISVNDTLYVNLSNFKKKTYTIELSANGLNNVHAILEDRFTGEKHILHLQDTVRANFTTTNDPASSDANRFIITFNNIINASNNPDNADKNVFVRMLPNPVSNELNVSYKLASSDATTILMYNQLGQLVKTVKGKSGSIGNIVIPVSELATGAYTITLLQNGISVNTQQVLKK